MTSTEQCVYVFAKLTCSCSKSNGCSELAKLGHCLVFQTHPNLVHRCTPLLSFIAKRKKGATCPVTKMATTLQVQSQMTWWCSGVGSVSHAARRIQVQSVCGLCIFSLGLLDFSLASLRIVSRCDFWGRLLLCHVLLSSATWIRG